MMHGLADRAAVPPAPDTIPRRTADGWRNTNHKIYSTGSPGLPRGLVWARTMRPRRVPDRCWCRSVPPAYRFVETLDPIGLRASGGRELLPRVHALVAERDRRGGHQAA
nr:hypothetical protein [uncultured Rhodopila sp.]